MKVIVMLPGGDWSVVDDANRVYFYEFTEKDFRAFEETGGEDTSLARGLGYYSPKSHMIVHEPGGFTRG